MDANFIHALRETLHYLKRQVSYADIRFEEETSEGVRVKDGEVERLWDNLSTGFGIRVLWKGAWGFAASSLLTKAEARRVAEEALAQARATHIINQRKVSIKGAEPIVAIYKTPCQIDPFTVLLEERLVPLLEATSTPKDSRVHTIEGFMEFNKTTKAFLNTEGSHITQEITLCGCGIQVIAIDGDEVQWRSYPDSHHGLFAARGYEHILNARIPENTPRVIEEALMLLKAPECPSGETTVILDGSQMALHIHESIGHTVELDRVMGMEVSLAGGSFLSADKIGTRIASGVINITADPTIPGGAGSYAYDDEGVKARPVDIVRGGRFVGYLTSRETVTGLGLKENGSVRAEGWGSIPLIRMSNINLLPDSGTLDELIADTSVGILLATNKSWSIDHRRLNFQFGTEMGWLIKRGRIKGVVKNPIYSGTTPEFWQSCDAVCGKEEERIWGLNTCGKGDPVQTISVGHRTVPARFRKVKVGSTPV